ncbi:trihelix transcription factor ASIL2 [Mangifera indica]|uniref:trihelix transcription factor ASIL2 n=1 Tax=Mangifera indica TaxID=29780 RepID=UPI001CFC0587|nr:trihelix transcription factor ASIL2 [Mangifera indica]
MDNTEDDARYSSNPYNLNRQKIPSYSRPLKNRFQYEEDDEDDEFDAYNEEKNEEEEYGVEFGETNGHRHNFKESENFERYPKRQKVRTAVSSYQFAPRSVKLSYDWSEHEAFVLLEIWGERFLQLGRKSLRSEDWVEVSEKVTEALKTEKTDTQCRRMMDELKRKYKKEKVKVEQMGVNSSKWVFFKKMDMLMDMRRECGGLACGLDSGEFVFMDTRVYLDRSNGFDEMRDSPTESELEDEEEDEKNEESSASLMMLADSVNKFGEIYEKIESSKREQMMELERMRMDFHREMELQKKKILERAQAEIAKIREADDDEDSHDDDGEGDSMENLSE